MHIVLSTKMSIGELMRHPKAKGLLLKMMPNIAQLPPRMQEMPMAMVLDKFGKAEMSGQIDVILAQLG